MELEKQVVSLEVSRELTEKLKSDERKTNTAFCWASLDGGSFKLYETKAVMNHHEKYGSIRTDGFHTYTLNEMLDMLHQMILVEDVTFFCAVKKDRVGYWNHDNSIGRSIYLVDDNQNRATACGNLMIWLIDNNYVTGV